MPDFLQDTSVLLTLIALLPGLIAWWNGRELVAIADDPILPERLLANQRRNGVALVLALAGLATLSPGALPFTAPLALLATFAGAYPMRRAIHGDTWSLPAYLAFFSRLSIALYGFWALLAWTPQLVAQAGAAGAVASPALGAMLLVWSARNPELVRRCLGTQPMPPGPLLHRCRQLAMACGLPQTRFEVLRVRGGVFANAFALPSRGAPVVLFSDPLLARLDEEEAAAIGAHELGHLEHYHPARLRRLARGEVALILVGVSWTPAAHAIGLGHSGWIVIAWLVPLVTAMALRAHGKQQQETACDARAVALIGDPEPLVRALTTLYAIARIPRRIESRHEQADTHPSLARRIRQIRAAAGVAPASVPADACIAGADGSTTVTFAADTVQWTGPDAVTSTIAYGHLAELWIDARRQRAPRLVMVNLTGRRWETTIAAADLERVQAILDLVDGRLSDAAGAPAIPRTVSRPLAVALALLTLLVGHVSAGFVAILACIRGVTPLLTAAGTAILASAAISLRDAPAAAPLVLPAAIAVAAAVFFVLAHEVRTERHADPRAFVAAIAAGAALAVVPVAAAGLDVVRLHQTLRLTPSVTILLAALAAALATSSSRGARGIGLAAAAAAVLSVAVASPAFLDRFGRDPLLVAGPQFHVTTLTGGTAGEFEVPPATSRIRMSPDGLVLAALVQSESDEPSTFRVGRRNQPAATLAADDLAFLDTDHVLTATTDAAGTTLRKVRLDDTRGVLWSRRLDTVIGSRLTFDARDQKWRLIGWLADRSLYRAEGTLGTADVSQMRWIPGSDAVEWIDAFATDGASALLMETRYDRGGLGALLPHRWTLILNAAGTPFYETRFSTVAMDRRTPLLRSRLGGHCQAGIAGDDALACAAYDGTRTRFVRVDAGGRVDGLGWLAGRFVPDGNVEPQWLTGWHDTAATAVRVSTGEAFRIEEDRASVGHVTVSGSRIVAVVFDGRGPTVRTYRLDRAPTVEANGGSPIPAAPSRSPVPQPPPSSSAPR